MLHKPCLVKVYAEFRGEACASEGRVDLEGDKLHSRAHRLDKSGNHRFH
jgi:hypothetical protein